MAIRDRLFGIDDAEHEGGAAAVEAEYRRRFGKEGEEAARDYLRTFGVTPSPEEVTAARRDIYDGARETHPFAAASYALSNADVYAASSQREGTASAHAAAIERAVGKAPVVADVADPFAAARQRVNGYAGGSR